MLSRSDLWKRSPTVAARARSPCRHDAKKKCWWQTTATTLVAETAVAQPSISGTAPLASSRFRRLTSIPGGGVQQAVVVSSGCWGEGEQVDKLEG